MSAAEVPGAAGLLTLRSAPVAAARRLTRTAGRAATGSFLVEGPQAVREAVAAGLVQTLFATPDGAARAPDLIPDHLVDERALAALADAVTPQGLVAVARQVALPLDEALPDFPRLVVVLVEPRDPGNLGAIVRTADAAGADAVVVLGDAVDVHNGKAVRASAGSLFHLPVGVAAEPVTAVARLRGRGLRLVAADAAAGDSLDDVEAAGGLVEPTAWLFGNEAHGLPAEVVEACDQAVAVPIHGRAESLNLAAAAAVCLYASARAQRWQTALA